MRQNNFLIVKFGDNDFSKHLFNAVKHLKENHGYGKSPCAHSWKTAIVNCAVAHYLMYWPTEEKGWDYLNFIKRYLSEMTVTFEETSEKAKPDNGSSIAFDLNTGYIWTF
jgi:hypothetical protein